MTKKIDYIDNLYNLLVIHKFIGYEEENYRCSMYGLLFNSDSNKQKNIRSTLAKEGIILRGDDNLDTFLFYLSYYTFIKTDRDFLHGKSCKEFPNKNLGYHLKKKDRSLWWMGVQFLLLYDTYTKTVQGYEEEEDIKNEFCRQIRFSHQYVDSNLRNDKQFKKCMKMGKIYEDAFSDRYMGELRLMSGIERELFVQLLIGNRAEFEKRVIEHLKSYFIYAFELKRNDEKGKTTDEIDSIFFDLLFFSKLWKRISDLINLDYLEISDENKSLLKEVKVILKSEKNMLKEYFSIYAKHMQENTFLIVGSYMIIFEELREHKAQINQLEALREKISQGCIHNQAEESVWKYDYVNYELDSIPIKDLMDYFIPDAEERKTSDRNTIKARIKTIREVLRYVIICPDFEDIREIKMLYREFYIERNGLLGSSKYASFLKILEEQDESKIDYLDMIRLKELYIALKYLSNNKKQEYMQYNLQKQEYLKEFMEEIFIEPFGIPEK